MMCCVGLLVGVVVLAAQLRVAGTASPDVVRHVSTGVATAVVLSAVLLSFPAWWALGGSAHLGSWVWPRWTIYHDVTHLGDYVTGTTQPAGIFFVTLTGVVPNLAFIGFGVLVAFAAALVVAVRNGVLWLLGALGVLGVLLGLAGSLSISPFQVVFRLPVVHNILPQRWLGIVMFAAAMGVGIGVTELVAWARARTRFAVLGGSALLALAVVPIAVNDAAFAPLPVGPVAAPTWFTTHHTGVLMMTPTPNSIATGMTWEAVSGLPTALVGGWGPEVHRRVPKVQANATLELWRVTVTKTSLAEVLPRSVRDVRGAAREWGVTDVLAAAPGGTPAFAWGRAPTAAVGLFVEAFGLPTSTGPGWWAWHLSSSSTGLVVTTSYSHHCDALAGANVAIVISCLTDPGAQSNRALLRPG